MSVYGLIDFFPKRKEIKEKYQMMSFAEKKIYKMEIYSLCFENEYTKDCIWEYLNCNEDEELLCNANLFAERRKKRR